MEPEESLKTDTTKVVATEDPAILERIRTARALSDQGDHNGALVVLDAALTAAPTSGLANLEWGVCAQMTGAEPARVGAALKRATEFAPQNPRTHFERALFEESQGRIDDAIDGYRRTLALRSDHARARTRLGALRLQTGDAAAAMESLVLAVALDPAPIPPRVLLAEAAEAAGNVDLAIKTLRGLTTEFPTAVAWRRRLIDVYLRAGRDADADKERAALEAMEPSKTRKLSPLKGKRRRSKSKK